jgi:tripartite-type tricarboxylate transporter receptor subunit TctC
MQNRTRLPAFILLTSLLAWGAVAGIAAAEWPEKHVDFVNPWGAGSAADIQARKLAEIISRELGQPLTVRNVTGAGGAIAFNEVQRAKPDGYTLLWYGSAINTLAARKQIKYDYNAFEHVAGVGFETVSIAVSKTAPWKDFREFIAHIKQNPGKVTIGNSGLGSVTHLVPTLVASKIGAPIIHVPFGTGLAVAALMGGKIDASSQLPAEILGQIRAGEVRVLAMSGEKRSSLWPDVPTMKESGVDVVYSMWRGFAAPKGTPRAIVDKMSAHVRKAVESREWIEFTASVGTTPQYFDPEAFVKLAADMDKVTREIITAAGLK